MAFAERNFTGARCTRADCNPFCKELELLYGDLRKIKDNNKQLHEQLGALQSHASTREAPTQQTLQRKDNGILYLAETVNGLAMDLQQQNEVMDATKVSSFEKLLAVPSKQEFEALKTRYEVFESTLKVLQAQTERKTANGRRALQRVTQMVKKKSRGKRCELCRMLKANKMLRSEAKKMLHCAEQSLVVMTAMRGQLKRYREVADGQILEITQLHTTVKQLEQKKVLLEGKRIKMEDKESDVNALVSATMTVLVTEKAALSAELSELQRKLRQPKQQQYMQNGKEVCNDEEKDTVWGCTSTATDDLEKQLEMLRGLSVKPVSLSSRMAVDSLAPKGATKTVQQVDYPWELKFCLDDLVAIEVRKEELQQKLYQHTALCQHIFQIPVQFAAAETRLRNELENKDFKVKRQRYQAELHLFGHGRSSNRMISDALISRKKTQVRSEVSKLTQELAVYEVNEVRVNRNYQQLYNEWCSNIDNNRLLQRVWSEMEKASKYRVLYPVTQRQRAEKMVERMKKTSKKHVLCEFVSKQKRVMMNVLKRHNALCETIANYLEIYKLPVHLSRAQHSIIIVQVEKSAKCGVAKTSCDSVILQDRINRLKKELHMQTDHVKELEEANPKHILTDDKVQSLPIEQVSGDGNKLRNTKELLYEKINEVEQLYETLLLECTKCKDIASLASPQTKQSAREQDNREHREKQLRELLASSEGHIIVAELQHQFTQIKVTHQPLLAQYNLFTETQQPLRLKKQLFEPKVEKKAEELAAVREKSSDNVEILENVVCQVNDRGWTARNTRWEAFRKRLNLLEIELQLEQQHCKQLNKSFEDEQVQLPLDVRQQYDNRSKIGQPKSHETDHSKNQVALETVECLHMRQLQAASKTILWKEKETRLQAELSETRMLNENLNCQLETIQSRISELLWLNGELESGKRESRCICEDLELDMQNARTELSDEHKRQQSSQWGAVHRSSHSSLTRRNMEVYKKDQGAQVIIASLKQLVEEKTTLINTCQRKLAIVRASNAQDRLKTSQVNKKLTKENQRMVAQLKQAMTVIRSMKGFGKSKQALQVARERHDHVKHEWEQAEVALERARQKIREFQMVHEVLQNERDLAEACAGEALEEIVLLKDKEEKLKLLCKTIIKLKEEFLELDEVESAEDAMNQDSCARKRHKDEEDKWQEETTRLNSEVPVLQKKLALLKNKSYQQCTKCNAVKESAKEKESALESENQALRNEVERLKRLLKDNAVSEARAIEDLEKKIKILQAQNLALRVASTDAPTDIASAKWKYEQLENERKLLRRVEIMTSRLKQKQADVTNKDEKLKCCIERISNLESELQSEQAKHEEEHLVQNARAPAAKQEVEELEFHLACLRETLALTRKEWEDFFSAQMKSHEAQLQHVRRRLVQRGMPLYNSIFYHNKNDTIGHGSNALQLQREEKHILDQEVQEENVVLSDEPRDKEQKTMVAKNTRLLELKLENESLRLEYMRLRRKKHCGSGGLPDSEDVPKQLYGAEGGNGGSKIFMGT